MGRDILGNVAAVDTARVTGFLADDAYAIGAGTGVRVARETLNVLDTRFGATGDGTTDDTIAVQAALTAAAGVPGARVAFPAGKVFRTTQLTVASDTVLEGGGTLKRFGNSTQALITAGAAVARVKLTGLTVDGNAVAGTLISFPNGSNDLAFERSVFKGYTGANGIAINLATGLLVNKRVRVTRNDFFGDPTAVNAISLILGAGHVWVEGNYFTGGGVKNETSSTVTEVARSIHINYNDFEDIIASCILVRPNGATTIEEVEIVGNESHHTGIGDPGNAVYKGLAVVGENPIGSTLSMTRGIVIAENVAKYFGGHGLSLGGGTGLGRCEDATIVENSIDGSDDAGNIDSTGTVWGTSAGGINLVNVAGFSVAANRVRRTPISGIRMSSGGADPTQITRNGSITGNTVEETAVKTDAPNIDRECGIMAWGPVNDVVISANVSKNTGRQLALQAGIGTDGTAAGLITGISITNNRCYDDRGVKFQAYGVRLGYTGADAGQPSNCTIANNDLRGNATDAYKIHNTADHGHRLYNNQGLNATPTVASAATIALISENVVIINGTTTINTINGGWPGREVTLIFQSTAGVGDSVGNVKLSATFTGTADDTLTLVSDGVNWYEKSRSAN